MTPDVFAKDGVGRDALQAILRKAAEIGEQGSAPHHWARSNKPKPAVITVAEQIKKSERARATG